MKCACVDRRRLQHWFMEINDSLHFFMKRLSYRHWLMLIVIAAELVGCHRGERDTRIQLKRLDEQYDTWSAAALVTFDSARYYKPNSETTSIDALTMQFSPLVVQASGRMLPAIEAAEEKPAPAMFVSTLRLRIGDASYDVITYQWLASRDARFHGNAKEVRGLRVTVGQDGFAAVCEVLQPGSPFRRMFVSKSIEEAARMAHGEPLMGRRFAIESAIDTSPDVLVVGVFDDGPIPMGPYVYLDAALDVTAIRCRCSDSLVDTFTDEAVYEFLSIEDLPRRDGVAHSQDEISPIQSLRWPNGFDQ